MSQILSGLAYQRIAFDVPSSDSSAAKSVGTGVMDFSVNSAWTLDPTQSNQLLEVQNIQSIFVDNYANTGTLTITVAGSGHVIRIPPKSQAFMPLLCGDRPVISFSNYASGTTTPQASGKAQCCIQNFPALGVIWQIP